jgi:FkbM family methyltransferase
MRILEASSRIMNRCLRRGVDVAIAFDSGKRRNAASFIASENVQDIPLPLEAAAVAPEQPAEPAPAPLAVNAAPGIKRFLRPLARLVFRSIRPFAAPLAFRARRYFTEAPMQQLEQIQHLLHAQGRSLDQRLAASESQLQAVRDELRAAHEQLRDELASSRKLLLQETQIVREIIDDEFEYARETAQEIASRSAAQSHADIGALHLEIAGLQHRLEQVEAHAGAAARRVALASGPDAVLVRTAVGYLLCQARDHAVLTTLLESGDLEPGTRRFIQAFLQPGATYVDVGAHIGMHVLAAAQAMQGKGRIICFEPFAASAALLKESIALNGYADLVEVHQAAVSAATGSANLYLGKISGHHSLFPLSQECGSGAVQAATRLVRLDDAIGAATHVDLLKIDAEAAELDVLDGAAGLVRANPEIGLIVELGLSHLQRFGTSLAAWLARFEALGLSGKSIDAQTGRLQDWTEEQLARAGSLNLFFARPGARAWRIAEAADE